MDAGEEDGVAGAEEVVGPVAVMEVPVEDEDPARAERVERVLRRYRDVVEQTEARRRRAARVMTGRARSAEPCASLAGHEGVGHRARPARGMQRGAIGPGAEHCLAVQAAAAGALGAHLLDVSLSAARRSARRAPPRAPHGAHSRASRADRAPPRSPGCARGARDARRSRARDTRGARSRGAAPRRPLPLYAAPLAPFRITAACPCPPPTHSVATPRCRRSRFISCSSVTRMRPPLAPIG